MGSGTSAPFNAKKIKALDQHINLYGTLFSLDGVEGAFLDKVEKPVDLRSRAYGVGCFPFITTI